MKKYFTYRLAKILFSIVIFSSLCYANGNSTQSAPDYNGKNKFNTSSQTNSSIDFYNFISGVNTAIVITPTELKSNLENKGTFLRKYNNLMRNYLRAIGFETIAISSEEHSFVDNNKSLSETAVVNIDIDVQENYLFALKLKFKSCNQDEFIFSQETDYYLDENWDSKFSSYLKEMFYHSVNKDVNNKLNLTYNETEWTEKTLRNYYNNSNEENIEGIYTKFSNESNSSNYKIAIVKNAEKYNIIYLEGAKNNNDWKAGELKGEITATAMKDFYQVDWIMADKKQNKNVYLSTTEENFLTLEFMNGENSFSVSYLKVFPSINIGNNNASLQPLGTGTGFAISNDGIFITNHHVVEGAKEIKIQLQVGEKVKSYKAEVITKDVKNDLAAIKINDEKFKAFDQIPYSIKSQMSNLGSDVFTLGYPLVETMGESIKLTDGIISSRNGYKGHPASYQITVAINPGNSGGPLFDINGNLIGVIAARHSEAENTAYAVKTNRLLSFVKRLEAENIIEVKENNKKKNLSDLASSYEKYVGLIKTN